MKKILLGVLLMFLGVGAWAVPARPGQWKMLRLADGTEVRAELKGDEHCHYWQSEDGRVFVPEVQKADIYRQVERKDLKYAMPMEFGQSTAVAEGPLKILGKPHTEPITGVMKGLVVLVQFSDVKFQQGHDRALYDRILNEKNFSEPSMGFVGSVNDYFMEQSDGRFDYQFDVVGPVTLKNKATYYGGESGYDNMKEFVEEALNLIKADVNFSTYDNDKDGYADEIFFQFAGKGLNDGGTNCIWPHMYWYKTMWGGYFKQNRTFVDTYACANEIAGSGRITGIGTLCHEFSHCLDLPDMYDTVDGNHPLGTYSLMDMGCYNQGMFVPAGFTAYEREFCGWRKIEELGENAAFDNLKPVSEGGVAYKMTNKANPDEYFIVEPRSKKNWDASIANDGFLIYHIDYTKPQDWTDNAVNTTSKNRTHHNNVKIVPAKNGTSYEDMFTFPISGADSFNDNTTVSSELYYDNTDGSRKLHKGVYGMKKNADGTFSFRYEAEEGYSNISEIGMGEAGNSKTGFVYNLNGQRVASGYRGLQVVDGRKMVKR